MPESHNAREPDDRAHVSTGSKAEGYPCPKDGATLTLIADKGAWCPECHTVWLQIGEVSLKDLDELPEASGG